MSQGALRREGRKGDDVGFFVCNPPVDVADFERLNESIGGLVTTC